MDNWIEYTESTWRDLQMSELKVDEAFMQVFSPTNKMFWIYDRYQPCIECPFSLLKKITEHHNVFKLDVSQTISLKVYDRNQGKYDLHNNSAICTIEKLLGEFGVYNLTIHDNKTCSFVIDKNPVNIYLSLLTVFLIVLCICLVIKGYFFAVNKYFRKPSEENDISNEPAKKRLKSLDIFRGLVIVLMIFVNSGGGKYWWSEHAPWNGLHLADIVFPSFLWIMGVCIPISISSQLKRSIPKHRIFKNIISRSFKLFFIGLFLNSINGPLLSELRIMGVLQRFGICYLFCATVHLFCTKYRNIITQNYLHRTFVDIILLKSELILTLCLIIINLAITLGLKKPDCQRGYLGPGGKHKYPTFVNCTGGIIGYIDEQILGNNHIYKHSTAKYLYDGKDFDPEGVFGCLLSTVQVFLGVQCGVLLTTFSDWKSKTSRLICWGILLFLIGAILSGFSVEGGYIPINKNMWSLSFVFVTTGISFLIFVCLFLIVDVKMIWSGYPFIACGMNAIIMYIGHSVLHKMLPWHWRIGLMNTHFVLLLEACWNTSLWIIISLYLYNKKIFYNI